ncbi:GFA family protein [Octadecabacter sp. G9-8]|uniref:GFA family protein n=1 Tax=Octadecabacter dasysiphoniae TaxID=2909341 RepID=A0ABS9CY27_9RHOB|nr:GFA family protein [Octadecabacter dasysiphoniae]MCF2871304.1 GFA family protein [Octadecabacter dasysiphoniae]
MKTGSCLCGGVAYTLTGELRPSVACHCVQCRKTSGHHVSATQVNPDQLQFTSDATLAWFQSSPKAQRGFCNHCGSSLFWRHEDDGGRVSVMSGTIDGATGLHTDKHIYVADKGDYYEIADGLPQLKTY